MKKLFPEVTHRLDFLSIFLIAKNTFTILIHTDINCTNIPDYKKTQDEKTINY
jgi:hypothetical protein